MYVNIVICIIMRDGGACCLSLSFLSFPSFLSSPPHPVSSCLLLSPPLTVLCRDEFGHVRDDGDVLRERERKGGKEREGGMD